MSILTFQNGFVLLSDLKYEVNLQHRCSNFVATFNLKIFSPVLLHVVLQI